MARTESGSTLLQTGSDERAAGGHGRTSGEHAEPDEAAEDLGDSSYSRVSRSRASGSSPA